MKRAALAIAVLSPWFLGGWGSPPDSLEMSLDLTTGQLVPLGLPHPETWICLGMNTTSNKAVLRAVWVKPAAMPPRETPSDRKAAADRAIAYCSRPLTSFPEKIAESFEFRHLSRNRDTPSQLFESLKQALAKECPSVSITLTTLSDTELLYEVRSGGCPAVGDQDQINRLVFGRHELYSLFYKVNAAEMSSEQRELGIKALTAWKMQ